MRRENLAKALKRVCTNKGSPFTDGMTVDEFEDYLKDHLPEIREQLRKGRYDPQPVKEVVIPKPGGETQMLRIPIVVDRFIQQALPQVLNPI